jgi:DNA-binding PadR family transcriptional regulator
MEDDGLISSGGHKKSYYALTQKGVKFYLANKKKFLIDKLVTPEVLNILKNRKLLNQTGEELLEQLERNNGSTRNI